MKRIASGSQSTSAPASYAVDVGTPGYFIDAATSPSGSPTQLTPKWCNMVQEAVVQTIEGSGAALADTLSQFATTVVGVHGIKSHASLASGSTANKRVIIASDSATATGAQACVIGGSGFSTASGSNALIAGATSALASGTYSAVVGCDSSSATANRAGCFAGSNGTASANDAAVVGGTSCTASAINSAVVGGDTCSASGARSVAIGGDTNAASGADSACVGGIDLTASGARSVAIGGDTNAASGADSVIAGGDDNTCEAAHSFIAGCNTSKIKSGGNRSAALGCIGSTIFGSNSGRVMLGSRNTCLASSNTTGGVGSFIVGGGYSVTALSGSETANTNVTWTIESLLGTAAFAGGAVTDDPSADVAEMHPNEVDGPIPPGVLLSNRGMAVRQAAPGDAVFGVVSVRPGLLLGGNAHGWGGRFQRDEWGRDVVVDVPMVRWTDYDGPEAAAPTLAPADAERYTLPDRVLAAGFDPARSYVSRSDRPAEWTPVAKLGLVPVRVARGVAVGDLLAPGKDGVAVATDTPRGRRTVEVMEITSPYDAARGYAIARCDVG